MKKKKELQQKLDALMAEEAQQLERLSDEGLSGQEEIDYNTRRERIEQLNDEIARYEEAERKIRDAEALAAQTNRARREPAQVHNNEQDRPWASLGEQLCAIAFASSPYKSFNGAGGQVDPRLYQTLAPSGASAQVPADGAVLIGKQYTDALMQRVNEESQLLSRCDNVPIAEGNDGLEAPYIDETSRATGSRWGGVQVYWGAETNEATAKKPSFNKHTLALEELKGLAYVTDRLLKNAPALESIFSRAFGEEFGWKIDDGVLFGNGAGQMLGIMNSPSLVSVSKDSGQAASTVTWKNIVNMRARLHPRSRRNMVWLVNVDVEPQLQQMYFEVGTAAVPVYLPAGGATSEPFSTLFGRPVIPIEQCKTVGTTGDIILADLSQYLVITQGGLRSNASMHVRFIYDEMTFKWNYSINGMPKWKTAITPANGANTLSPFVALATRA